MSKKKYELPPNCSIERVGETKSDLAFQLRFMADEGEDFVSEVYEPEKGLSIRRTAFLICRKFDWDRNPPASRGRLISNLKEFLDWRGCGDDPYSWARAYYKYTDCGPWVNFLELIKPAHEIQRPSTVAIVRCVRGHAQLMNPTEVDPKLIELLSLDEHGLDAKERAWDHYCGLVDEYLAAEEKQRTSRTLELVHKTMAEWHLRMPARTEFVEADYREIYYEDLGRGTVTLDPEKCCGIQFGSIVEGSEQCSGPYTHLFPFWSSEWTRDEEHMEKETSYFWTRDNSQWYRLQVRGQVYELHNTWGEITWGTDKPSPKLVDKVEAFINEHFDEIPREPGMWAAPKKKWKPAKIPGTRATIHEWINDLEF
jgi:hypothetical protein